MALIYKSLYFSRNFAGIRRCRRALRKIPLSIKNNRKMPVVIKNFKHL